MSASSSLFTRSGETMLAKYETCPKFCNRRMLRSWPEFQIILIGIKKCASGGLLWRFQFFLNFVKLLVYTTLKLLPKSQALRASPLVQFLSAQIPKEQILVVSRKIFSPGLRPKTWGKYFGQKSPSGSISRPN